MITLLKNSFLINYPSWLLSPLYGARGHILLSSPSFTSEEGPEEHTFPVDWAASSHFLSSKFAQVISQFSSVSWSCPTLSDPTHCSMPGFPVHHQLPEIAQTYVHQVSNAIQPSRSLSSPSQVIVLPNICCYIVYIIFLQSYFYILIYYSFYFLATPLSTQNLSSLTMDPTHDPCSGTMKA